MMNIEHGYDFIKFYVSFPITVLIVKYTPNTLGFACQWWTHNNEILTYKGPCIFVDILSILNIECSRD